MENYKPISSPNTDPQLLLESGPMQLKDFNPRGVLRFSGRLCISCAAPIMDHWLRYADDPDIRGAYWCTKDGNQFSLGIADPKWDVNISLPDESTK
jgi:hypothetical protein